MLVRFFSFFLFFFDFLESFFLKKGKKRIFLFFLHFFEERIEKILIIFGEIREKGKMDLARAKKVFSASRQKKNLFEVFAVIVFLKALSFSG